MIIQIPSKRRIAATFSAKANGYQEEAYIQKQILALLVPFVKTASGFSLPWLDAGCGAGGMAGLLKENKVPVRLMRTDLAYGMLRCRRSPGAVQSDIEGLPFRDGVFGGAVVASVLHWLEDPSKGMGELFRVLAAGGALVFSGFLQGSFSEIFSLRQERNLSVPVRLPSRDDFSALLAASGFDCRTYLSFEKQYRFASAMDALKYMSETGSTAVEGRRLSLREIIKLCREYENNHSEPSGVPLSINVAYGLALKK
ncbi:MAG TPA: methyltransferase domain-containing protein [Chitinivibrionales bacterium]|jgi:malonyl-CoA O-methyltransferase|nr:methyltransferase domain-containing protein [Chitinivibrionales bacterium]